METETYRFNSTPPTFCAIEAHPMHRLCIFLTEAKSDLRTSISEEQNHVPSMVESPKVHQSTYITCKKFAHRTRAPTQTSTFPLSSTRDNPDAYIASIFPLSHPKQVYRRMIQWWALWSISVLIGWRLSCGLFFTVQACCVLIVLLTRRPTVGALPSTLVAMLHCASPVDSRIESQSGQMSIRSSRAIKTPLLSTSARWTLLSKSPFETCET